MDVATEQHPSKYDLVDVSSRVQVIWDPKNSNGTWNACFAQLYSALEGCCEAKAT